MWRSVKPEQLLDFDFDAAERKQSGYTPRLEVHQKIDITCRMVGPLQP